MIRVARPGGKVAILEFSRPRGAILGRIYLGFFRNVLPKGGADARAELVQRVPLPPRERPPVSRRPGDARPPPARGADRAASSIRSRLGIASLYVGTKPATAAG